MAVASGSSPRSPAARAAASSPVACRSPAASTGSAEGRSEGRSDASPASPASPAARRGGAASSARGIDRHAGRGIADAASPDAASPAAASPAAASPAPTAGTAALRSPVSSSSTRRAAVPCPPSVPAPASSSRAERSPRSLTAGEAAVPAVAAAPLPAGAGGAKPASTTTRTRCPHVGGRRQPLDAAAATPKGLHPSGAPGRAATARATSSAREDGSPSTQSPNPVMSSQSPAGSSVGLGSGPASAAGSGHERASGVL